MSIQSTYEIKREDALTIIASKLLTLSDEQLENILEEVDDSIFRNFSIVDEPSGWNAIKSVREF